MKTSFPGYRKARTGFFCALEIVVVVSAAVAVPAMADGEFMALESDQARKAEARDYCEVYHDFGAYAKACERNYIENNFTAPKDANKDSQNDGGKE